MPFSRCSSGVVRPQFGRETGGKSLIGRAASRNRHPDARGFTLVEVVVGLVLMASVLVAALMAFSAHQRQLRFADSKLVAVELADELMGRFVASSDGIPRSGRGLLAGHAGWYWQTRTVGIAAPAGVAVQVIRFEIIDSNAERQRQVLVQLDVVRAT